MVLWKILLIFLTGLATTNISFNNAKSNLVSKKQKNEFNKNYFVSNEQFSLNKNDNPQIKLICESSPAQSLTNSVSLINVSFLNVDVIKNNTKEDNKDTFSRRITKVVFDDAIFNDSTLSNENLALNESFGKKIFFNNKSLYEIATKDSSAEIVKANNNEIEIRIPLKYYEKQIAQEYIELEFKNLTTFIANITNFSLSLVNGHWVLNRDFELKTFESGQFKENNGYNLAFETEFILDQRVDLSKTPFEIGLYMVNKSTFDDSSYSTIDSFISNNLESASTYRKHPYTSRLFEVMNKTSELKSYKYKVSAKIDKENYRADLIPVGYLNINNKKYYGQTGSYATSLYKELSDLHVNPDDYEDVFTENFTVTLNITNKNYELVDNSYDKNIATLTYDSNGYYKVTANHKINQFIVNGQTFNKTLSVGESTYVRAYKNKAEISSNKAKMKLGFSEPNVEIWADTNSSIKNTYANNAAIQSEFGAKTARIWVSPSYLLDSAWPAIGLVDPVGTDLNNLNNCFTYNIKFKQSAVKTVQDTIAAYRAAGVEEINLMVNGFVYSYADEFFSPDVRTSETTLGSWYNLIRLGQGASPSSVFPHKENNAEAFNRWLNGNKDFYKALFNNFDVDLVEPLNEINLAAYSKSPDFLEAKLRGNIVTECPTVVDQRTYREQIVGYTMDYCKAINDAVNESNRKNIRVTTPAIAVIGDWLDPSPYYIEGQVSQIRNGNDFLDMCYDYIESQNDSVSEYFQIINLHPYVFHDYLTAQNDNYLYNGKTFNTNYVQDWVNSMNSIHQISVNHNDGYTPVIASEFGFTDYEGFNETGLYPSSDLIDFGKSNVLPNAVNSLIPAASNLPYFESLQWFRMYSFGNKYNVNIQTNIDDTDFNAWNQFVLDMNNIRCTGVACAGSSGGKFTATATIDFDSLNFKLTGIKTKVWSATYQGHTFTITSLADSGEPNFGFISKNFELKKWGKDLFYQFTGKTDTSSVEALLESLNS